jgi:hypothetical protein
MINNKNISANFNYTHWNINSRKVDTVQNLDVLSSPIPRKTHISGHFHLIQVKFIKNKVCKQLIFN